jgi:hypothetical protein
MRRLRGKLRTILAVSTRDRRVSAIPALPTFDGETWGYSERSRVRHDLYDQIKNRNVRA